MPIGIHSDAGIHSEKFKLPIAGVVMGYSGPILMSTDTGIPISDLIID